MLSVAIHVVILSCCEGDSVIAVMWKRVGELWRVFSSCSMSRHGFGLAAPLHHSVPKWRQLGEDAVRTLLCVVCVPACFAARNIPLSLYQECLAQLKSVKKQPKKPTVQMNVIYQIYSTLGNGESWPLTKKPPQLDTLYSLIAQTLANLYFHVKKFNFRFRYINQYNTYSLFSPKLFLGHVTCLNTWTTLIVMPN